MPRDGAPIGTAVHATAVAIKGRALAIIGASRSGKSTLAAALMAKSTPRHPIELIGDDRVLLVPVPCGAVVVRPHPRIAGFMERRGLGLVCVPHCVAARLYGVVDLGRTAARRSFPANLSTLALGHVSEVERRLDLVSEWWTAMIARQPEHSLSGKRR